MLILMPLLFSWAFIVNPGTNVGVIQPNTSGFSDLKCSDGSAYCMPGKSVVEWVK